MSHLHRSWLRLELHVLQKLLKRQGGGFHSTAFKPQSDEGSFKVFGLYWPCTENDVNKAYRKKILSNRLHPDLGGSTPDFIKLTHQRDKALEAIRHRSAAGSKAAAWGL